MLSGQWFAITSLIRSSFSTSAMKRGSTAILTGVSGRGTQTRDTFSLLGFTAAVEEAARRCG